MCAVTRTTHTALELHHLVAACSAGEVGDNSNVAHSQLLLSWLLHSASPAVHWRAAVAQMAGVEWQTIHTAVYMC
jgi:hypothetical protein